MDGHDRLRRQLVEALKAHLGGVRGRVPEAGALLWGAFADLNAARSWHAHGPNPIPFAEIEAWGRLHRYPLAPHHVETLRAMDSTFLMDFAERAKREAEKSRRGR